MQIINQRRPGQNGRVLHRLYLCHAAVYEQFNTIDEAR